MFYDKLRCGVDTQCAVVTVGEPSAKFFKREPKQAATKNQRVANRRQHWSVLRLSAASNPRPDASSGRAAPHQAKAAIPATARSGSRVADGSLTVGAPSIFTGSTSAQTQQGITVLTPRTATPTHYVSSTSGLSRWPTTWQRETSATTLPAAPRKRSRTATSGFTGSWSISATKSHHQAATACYLLRTHVSIPRNGIGLSCRRTFGTTG